MRTKWPLLFLGCRRTKFLAAAGMKDDDAFILPGPFLVLGIDRNQFGTIFAKYRDT